MRRSVSEASCRKQSPRLICRPNAATHKLGKTMSLRIGRMLVTQRRRHLVVTMETTAAWLLPHVMSSSPIALMNLSSWMYPSFELRPETSLVETSATISWTTFVSVIISQMMSCIPLSSMSCSHGRNSSRMPPRVSHESSLSPSHVMSSTACLSHSCPRRRSNNVKAQLGLRRLFAALHCHCC